MWLDWIVGKREDGRLDSCTFLIGDLSVLRIIQDD